MKENIEITEEQIIECFGSLEKYESIALQVNQILIKEIEMKELKKQFENIDLMNSYVYPYLQSWVEENKDTINKVLEMKKKVFTKEDIEEYIKSDSMVSQELFDLKFKELFEKNGLSNEEQKRAEELETKLKEHISEEKAINEIKKKNKEQIQEYRSSYSEESFNSKLKEDIKRGLL